MFLVVFLTPVLWSDQILFWKVCQSFLEPGFLYGREASRSPMIWVLMSKFPNCDFVYRISWRAGNASFAHIISWTHFGGPCPLDGGLRSRVPNGSVREAELRKMLPSPAQPQDLQGGHYGRTSACRAFCQTRRSRTAGRVSDLMIPVRVFKWESSPNEGIY